MIYFLQAGEERIVTSHGRWDYDGYRRNRLSHQAVPSGIAPVRHYEHPNFAPFNVLRRSLHPLGETPTCSIGYKVARTTLTLSPS